jgi:squalene monooxygenase
MPVFDILIIGAGIAGCAAAKAFALQGRHVLLVERSLKELDRIVGELLQPGGVEALAKLGLSACVDDIDVLPVKGYHIYWRGEEEATFWFCAPPGTGSKPPEGRSFHHGRFAAKLREAVGAEPNVTIRGMTALEMLRDGETGAVTGARCAREGQAPEEVCS